MEKYQNKYRIQSHRKPNWDYSAEAMYFLTIVTQHRECILGTIVNHEMVLSDFGKIVEMEWFKSFEIRDELLLHTFVTMPNHLHGIVEIREKWDRMDGGTDGGTTDVIAAVVDSTATAEAHGRVSLPMNSIIPPDSIIPINPNDQISTNPTDSIDTDLLSIKRNPPIRLPKSISSFMAGFKSAVNTKIDDYIDEHQLNIPKYNKKNHFFQPNYHDHIIRNDREYGIIERYIVNNPMNWGKDKING
jgi:REP element-mobilizing transposase RayT